MISDSVMFQYYAKVVPTTYIDVHNEASTHLCMYVIN